MEQVEVQRSNKCLNILFFGASWSRKGGPMAVQILDRLRERTQAHLHIVGPRDIAASGPHLTPHGPLDKSTKESITRFANLCGACDIMLLPTRADCAPIAPAEVAGFGLPTMIADVGGCRDTVLEGESGWVMPHGATANDWASKVYDLWSTGELRSARAAARHAANRVFNWRRSVGKIVEAG
ncbi:glycosyltransferase [Actinomycetospora cinnamomea]|uniref:glycosyltransferase n=1 Tax=Actinomycetospora cinnamomea TaxID=663609 RepID=UPI003C301787